PALLVFLHPHCPCSRATVDEIAGVLARCPGPVSVRAFLPAPPAPAEGWADTPLRADLPPLSAPEAPDAPGPPAHPSGARPPGPPVASSADGRLPFRGGVPAGRGPRGPNPGREALLAALRDGLPSPPSPVFGCPLFPSPEPDEAPSND